MYGKSDTKGVTFKNPNGNTTTKSDNVQTIQCKPNINNIINIKASDLKNGQIMFRLLVLVILAL